MHPISKPSLLAQTDLRGAISNISNSLISLVGVIAILFLIIGGLRFITSAGNPENIEKARKTIIYAVIGLIIVLLAFSIIQFVVTNIQQK